MLASVKRDCGSFAGSPHRCQAGILSGVGSALLQPLPEGTHPHHVAVRQRRRRAASFRAFGVRAGAIAVSGFLAIAS